MLLKYCENKSDIKQCLGVIQKFPLPVDFHVVVKVLSGLAKEYEYEVYVTNLYKYFWLAEKSNVISQGVASLANLFLSAENINAFAALAFVISKIPKDLLAELRLNTQWFISKKEWAFKNRNDRLIGAYLLIMSRLVDRNMEEEILTSLLKDDSDLFERVVSTMRESLNAQYDDLTISLGLLSTISNEEQLTLLFVYILSTQNLGVATSELEKLDHLLSLVKSLDGVSSRLQASFVYFSSNLGKLQISQKILQHQLRSAILRNKGDQIRQVIEHLKKP